MIILITLRYGGEEQKLDSIPTGRLRKIYCICERSNYAYNEVMVNINTVVVRLQYL